MKQKIRKGNHTAILTLITFAILAVVFIQGGLQVNAAHLDRGRVINYSDWGLGYYSTHFYRIDYDGDGQYEIAYCFESEKTSPGGGDIGIFAQYGTDEAEMLCKVLYYGYGGPGEGYIRSLFGDNEDLLYLVTHISANYAFTGAGLSDSTDFYKGTSYEACEAMGVHTFLRGVMSSPPPDVNGRHFGGGQASLYRFSAGSQGIGLLTWSESAGGPTSIEISVPVTKSGDGVRSVNGAVYGLFESNGREIARITLNGGVTATGKFTEVLENSGSYYVQEITPPPGYMKDNGKYEFYVSVEDQKLTTSNPHIRIQERTANVSVEDIAISLNATLMVRKVGNIVPVWGAEYTLYRYDSADMSKNPAIETLIIDTPVGGSEVIMSASLQKVFHFEDVGKIYYIKETKIPYSIRYQLDDSVFAFRIVQDGERLRLEKYAGASSLVNGSTIEVTDSTFTAVSNEERLYDVEIVIEKKGENPDPKATVDGAVYTVYDAKKQVVGEITIKAIEGDPNWGSGKLSEILMPGTYTIQETREPLGYLRDRNTYTFTVGKDGKITSDSPAITTEIARVTAHMVDIEDIKPLNATIEVVKTGSCNLSDEKADVSKAKYGLFNEKDELLQEIELSGSKTRATGTFNYRIRSVGKYYIKETFSPEYFDLDRTKFEFTVSLVEGSLISNHTAFVVDERDKAKATVLVNEKPNKYLFHIAVLKKAVSTGDFTSLDGAVYGIFNEKGEEIERIALHATKDGARGETGDLIFSKEDAGHYYIQEIISPQGFRLNTKKYEFDVSVVNQKLVSSEEEIMVVDNNLSVNAVDVAMSGRFRFEKAGEDGLPMENAIFEVYLKSLLKTDSETGEYHFDGVKPHQVLTSDKDGKVISGELHLGTYVVREISAAPEYYLTEPFEVIIRQDQKTVVLEKKTDRNVPVYIRITKMDKDKNTVILKAGTTYEMVDSKGEVMADEAGNKSFSCDGSGVIMLPIPLRPGTYTIREIAPPVGYTGDSEPVTVKVDGRLEYVVENHLHIHDVEFWNTEKTGEIRITKTGSTLSGFENGKFIWQEAPLPGAEFGVYAAETIYSGDGQGKVLYEKDTLVKTLVTGKNGSAAAKNLPLGSYYLVEQKAPEGYLLDQKPIEVSLIDSKPSVSKIVETVTKYDEKQRIILDLYKYDSQTKKPLEGAEFAIYAEEDIRNFDGEIIVKKGSFLAAAKSDSDGKIPFALDLPFCKFRIEEVQAPYGYVRCSDSFLIDAKAPESNRLMVTYKKEWGNVPVCGDVIFTKTGESLTAYRDGKFIYENRGLAGAEFEVRALEVYTCDHAVDEKGNRTRYYEKDQLIETIRVGEDGNAEIRNYPLGTYYLVETRAPYGMTVAEKPYLFEIGYKDQDTPKVVTEVSLLNERQKIALTVGKYQRGAGIKLSGGIFELFAAEDIRNYAGEVIVKKDTSVASATAVDGVVDFKADLPHALYYIKETRGIDGYHDNPEIYPVDGRYKSQNIRKLAVDVMIYNDKIPGVGRLMLKVAGASLKKNPNNYITGDIPGTTGYSVLIGEEEEIAKSMKLGLEVILFGMALLFTVVGITVAAIGKMRKK